MKKILYFVFACLLVGAAQAQTLDYAWHGAGGKVSYREVLTQGEAVYLYGEFNSGIGVSADLDPTSGVDVYVSNVAQGGNSFVTKLDTAGNYLFSYVPDASIMRLSGMAIAPNGTIVVCGESDSTGADFDPGPGHAGFYGTYSHASFILFLDPNGNYLGHIEYGHYGQYPNEYGPRIYDIAVDPYNNLYFSGRLYGHVDMDFTSGIDTIYQLNPDGTTYVSKIDLNNSSYQWTGVFAVDSGYYEHDINQLSVESGELVLVGDYAGDTLKYFLFGDSSFIVTGNPNPYPRSEFAMSFTMQGAFVRGGTRWSTQNSASFNDMEGVVGGTFAILTSSYGSASDSTQLSLNGTEMWVPQHTQDDYILAVYDYMFNLQWYKIFYSNADLYEAAIGINYNSVAVVGGLYDSLMVDDGTSTSLVLQSPDYMGTALVYDSYGRPIASHVNQLISGVGASYPYSEGDYAALSPTGNLYILGGLEGEIDFDPTANVASSNATDTANYHNAEYILRLDLNGFVHAQDGQAPAKVTLYPNPAHERVMLRSDVAVQAAVLRDLQGRTIRSMRFDETLQFDIDVQGLASGMYILELQGDFGKASVRFAKQ